MFPTRVGLIIASHLSDAQALVSRTVLIHSEVEEIRMRLNFAKYLLINFPDTTVEIDADKVFEEFEQTMAKRAGK